MRITCVGAGTLGSAVLDACQKAGHLMACVDKDEQKAQPFLPRNVHYFETLPQALACDMIVLCLPDTQTVCEVLASCKGMLNEKPVVNLSYSTLEEVATAQQAVEAAGGVLLDGAVISHVEDLGGAHGYAVYSGPEAAFAAAKEGLVALGTAKYVGENIIGAKLLNYSATGAHYMFELSFLDGLALCKKYDFPTEPYIEHTEKAMPPLAEAAHRNIFLCLSTDEDYGIYDDNIHAMEQLVDLIQKSGAQPELTTERQRIIHDMLYEHWKTVMHNYNV